MIVLACIPRFTPTSNYSLGVLSDSLSRAKIQHDIIDINIDLYKRYAETDIWDDLEIFGIRQSHFKDADPRIKPMIHEFARYWANEIAKRNPKYLGISVFTHETRNWAEIICAHVRTVAPQIKIIIGGRGISDPGTPNASFALRMKKLRLIDHFILGEAEDELVRLIEGLQSTADSLQAAEIDDIDYLDPNRIPQHHYGMISSWYGIEDHQGSSGLLTKTKSYPDQAINSFARMIATKGCVKRCTFCDVPLYRSKFSFKSSQIVFDQIRRLIEDKDVRGILFLDDMINGNNKAFYGWLDMLATYLEDNDIHDFTWTSQFGLKKKSSFTADHFRLMARTGSRLTIGIDHFSDSILSHMEKRYNQDDIFDFITRAVHHGMDFNMFLFIIGYPTETRQDIEIFKQGLRWLSKYKDNMHAIDLGATCNVTVGSKLSKMPGMKVSMNQGQWSWEGNPDLTIEERYRRRQEIDRLAVDLGFNTRKSRTWKHRVDSWAISSQT